jgi:glyoxylase-like metal-dependent hydrolase (beta-lactamase superfamily II)
LTKPFASAADLDPKEETLELLADGVYALTAEGDPNVGAIEGDEFIVAFEARATPVMAAEWLARLREHTDKPIKYLVLSHYHAVRTLGAAAFDGAVIIAHANTRDLIAERGKEDWASEAARMPRLFKGAETIPGLTWPDVIFTDSLSIDLGSTRGLLHLKYLGRGHTKGDIVAWLPGERILFAGDLVEAQAALYTGDAYHFDWMSGTLDNLASLEARVIVGGRGAVARDDGVLAAIEQTRRFLTTLTGQVEGVRDAGGTLKEAFEGAHAALAPQFGSWPIFEHTMPFNVARVWEELEGAGHQIWTADRDREIWAQLQG